MYRATVWSQAGMRIVVMDSMSQVEDDDAGAIVVAASNGGQESGRFGAAARCGFVLLNDAGVGKDDAGIAGLAILNEAGIPAAAVGHHTAEISNGLDMWEHGVISYVNTAAQAAGVAPGALARPTLIAFAHARIVETST
ncbi:hypothetical protein [Actinoallomurus iriomotensis]|uniref:Uncharacterized protein n=1 Tax=Actinoallomurus iriomotensis TaxID=478107 RepID=A0A9W6RNM3_9ACTN|nr:hypothetical protein [Actinoallomurus iriomotensis]GLY78973.1 hypothetical protein Airi01_072400 [Actinoallomurus iriomotensis]